VRQSTPVAEPLPCIPLMPYLVNSFHCLGCVSLWYIKGWALVLMFLIVLDNGWAIAPLPYPVDCGRTGDLGLSQTPLVVATIGGLLPSSLRILNLMSHRNFFTWITLISELSKSDYSHLCCQYFRQMYYVTLWWSESQLTYKLKNLLPSSFLHFVLMKNYSRFFAC
jgi:hypothetical protein